ncbi:hypothetical protein [Vulcanisaeta distributa]|uniref:hypothetical protein n=1 Tax=Vulcanisaeta distributa TaxID=164451 RepID=UPI001FB2C47B|nr:hypothetical protein [Vulcanisaeta distributa]
MMVLRVLFVVLSFWGGFCGVGGLWVCPPPSSGGVSYCYLLCYGDYVVIPGDTMVIPYFHLHGSVELMALVFLGRGFSSLMVVVGMGP